MENNIVTTPVHGATSIDHSAVQGSSSGGNDGVAEEAAAGAVEASEAVAGEAANNEGEAKEAPTKEEEAAGEGEKEDANSDSETPPVEASGEKDLEFGKRFAQLSKRESDIRVKEAQIKEREKATQHLQELKSLAKDDPFAFLQATGISYDDLTKSILEEKDPGNKEIRELQSEVKRLNTTVTQEQQEKQKRDLDHAVGTFKNEIGQYMEGAEKFPYAKHHSSIEEIYEVVDNHYRATSAPGKTGDVLNIEDAVKVIDDFYREQQDKWIKFEPFKKVASERWAEKPGAPGANEPPPQGTQANDPPKTLTNDPKFSSPSSGNGNRLTHEERVDRAAALISFND